MGRVISFALNPDLAELADRAARVARDGVAEFGRFSDSWMNGYSRPFARQLADLGWIGMTWPTEYGGGGRPNIERVIVAEQLIAAGAPVASVWFADRQMGPCLIQFGTDAQRTEHLPGILSGDTTWCIGMSEPDAGSDLASLRTSAHRDGDEWVINGSKIWTSFGEVADYCYLICRTSTGSRPHEGISEIIVPMTASGISVSPIEDLTGNRHFCQVIFDEVRVPAANLVGVEGGAFRQTMRQLEHERGGIDRLVSNRWLYEAARAVADVTDPDIRQRIAELETGYTLGRFMVYREALGQAPPGFSAATKCYCTEHEQRVARFVDHVLGAATMLDTQTTRSSNYAPAYTIMGGTSNIMRRIIADRVLGMPR
ncbi:MAG: acyl-CoA dehydrogenase family protein [Actinobacteria bacterium]|nr:acyl-CoA dehydrogenase family protein [Actinomycetota bacterium]MCB9388833.1 acyl-CoA dehydrogenase family protein [Acidimicrobiia bacterium]